MLNLESVSSARVGGLAAPDTSLGTHPNVGPSPKSGRFRVSSTYLIYIGGNLAPPRSWLLNTYV